MQLQPAFEKGFSPTEFEQKMLGAKERECLPNAKLRVQNALIALYVETHLPASLFEERNGMLSMEDGQRDEARLQRLESILRRRAQRLAMKWAAPEGLGYSRALGDIVDRVNQATEPGQLDKVQKDLAFVRRMFEIESLCKDLAFDTKLEMLVSPSDPEVRAVLTRLQKHLEREVQAPTPLKKRSPLNN